MVIELYWREKEMRSMWRDLRCQARDVLGPRLFDHLQTSTKLRQTEKFECSTMKAYFVLEITAQDYKRFKTYIDEIPNIIARDRGKYIVKGVEPVVLEGEWNHERLVLTEFPDRTNADDAPERSGRTAALHVASQHDEGPHAAR
jgi:uncharacterized protein (DUF1330 family)